MAQFFPAVAREVSVGHDDPICGFTGHGHRMKVEVRVLGSYDPATGRSASVADLGEAMDELLREVDKKPLNVITPAQPTPEGFGLWVIERLLPSFPKIVEVKVWLDPQTSFSIQREPR